MPNVNSYKHWRKLYSLLFDNDEVWCPVNWNITILLCFRWEGGWWWSIVTSVYVCVSALCDCPPPQAHLWNYVPQPVTSLRRRVQDNAPAASYWLRRVLDGCRGEDGACNAPLPCCNIIGTNVCRCYKERRQGYRVSTFPVYFWNWSQALVLLSHWLTFTTIQASFIVYWDLFYKDVILHRSFH